MAEIKWKPLPTGLWTPPAAFVEVGNLLLQAFTDDGVPSWEISKKTGERGEWNIIAKGTADSFEAAKAAALFEAGAASWGHKDVVQRAPVVGVGKQNMAVSKVASDSICESGDNP